MLGRFYLTIKKPDALFFHLKAELYFLKAFANFILHMTAVHFQKQLKWGNIQGHSK